MKVEVIHFTEDTVEKITSCVNQIDYMPLFRINHVISELYGVKKYEKLVQDLVEAEKQIKDELDTIRRELGIPPIDDNE